MLSICLQRSRWFSGLSLTLALAGSLVHVNMLEVVCRNLGINEECVVEISGECEASTVLSSSSEYLNEVSALVS